MFLPPTSILEPTIYPFANKFYSPAILIKHHVWFLSAANLFISLNGILYGIHQSDFDQSLLFQEIIHYGEADGIGTNPYHPIPFDTLKKEIFNDFLHLLYWRQTIGTTSTRRLGQYQMTQYGLALFPCHCAHHMTICHPSKTTLTQMMANSLLVYRVMDEQV
jgi:hypothetical protein